MKVEVELPSESIAEDLLWHAAHITTTNKMRKALMRSAFYYMTFDEAAEYLGSREEAEEYWNEY